MAIYRVWSGGSGAGGADNTNWAQAYATLTSALAVPPVAGDKIYISHITQEAVVATTTWTLPNNVDLISVDKDSSEAPTAMGTGGWIGTGSTSQTCALIGGKYSYIYGVTVRNAGASNNSIALKAIQAAGCLFDTCYAWMGTTQATPDITLGQNSTSDGAFVEYRNLTVRFGNTAHGLVLGGDIQWSGGSVSSSGSAPSTLFQGAVAQPSNTSFQFSGVDFTHASGTLVLGTPLSVSPSYRFNQCRLSSSVTPLGSVTAATKAGPKVYLVDCSDNAGTPARGIWGYYDGLGSLTKETGIYRTDGATGWAWKAVGSANACYETPFTTPWIEFQNTVNTSITPRMEILRKASTTAYTDAQVWAAFQYKATSASDLVTFTPGDRQALTAFLAGTAGASQATGSGTGDWVTGSGSDWSGKCDSGSAITCAEDGVLRGRIAVVGAITVYIDPQIRT